MKGSKTKVKRVLSGSGYQWEGEDIRRGREGEWWTYFVFMFENRTMRLLKF
jgi:hypothetical protein